MFDRMLKCFMVHPEDRQRRSILCSLQGVSSKWCMFIWAQSFREPILFPFLLTLLLFECLLRYTCMLVILIGDHALTRTALLTN